MGMIFRRIFILSFMAILSSCSGAAGPGGVGGPILEDLGGTVMPPVSIPAPTLSKPNAGLVAATKPNIQGTVTVIGMEEAIAMEFRNANHQIALGLGAATTSQDICNSNNFTCCPIATNGSFDCSIKASISDVVYVYLTDGIQLSEPTLSKPDNNLQRATIQEMTWSAPNQNSPASSTGLCPTTADDWTWNKDWDETALLSTTRGVFICQGSALINSITLADVDLYQKIKVTSDGRVRFGALVNRSENIKEGLLFDGHDPENPLLYLPALQSDVQLLAFDVSTDGEVISIIRKEQQELIITNGLESKSTKLSLIGMGNHDYDAKDLKIVGDTIFIQTEKNIFLVSKAHTEETSALTLSKKNDGITFMQSTVDMTLSDDQSKLLVLTQRQAHVFQIQNSSGLLPMEAIRQSRRTIPLQKSLNRYGDMNPQVLRIKTVVEDGREIALIAVSRLGILSFDLSEAVNETPEEPQDIDPPLVNELLPTAMGI